MSDASTEIEAKFEVGDADRARLAAFSKAGDFRVTSRRSVEQRDVYYDTDAADLASAGATLRIRRSNNGAAMTFKGKRAEGSDAQDHVAERLEDEVGLSEGYERSATMDAEPPQDETLSPLRRARAIVGDGSLRPVAILENSRTVIDVKDSTAQHVELALDTCVATRLRDGRVVRFGEVELEAKAADRAVLSALSRELQEIAPSLTPSHRTKLQRALQ